MTMREHYVTGRNTSPISLTIHPSSTSFIFNLWIYKCIFCIKISFINYISYIKIYILYINNPRSGFLQVLAIEPYCQKTKTIIYSFDLLIPSISLETAESKDPDETAQT